jgi:hypothetical protein
MWRGQQIAPGSASVRCRMGKHKLVAKEGRLRIDAERLHMKTTDDVAPLSGIASQQRALKALPRGGRR